MQRPVRPYAKLNEKRLVANMNGEHEMIHYTCPCCEIDRLPHLDCCTFRDARYDA